MLLDRLLLFHTGPFSFAVKTKNKTNTHTCKVRRLTKCKQRRRTKLIRQMSHLIERPWGTTISISLVWVKSLFPCLCTICLAGNSHSSRSAISNWHRGDNWCITCRKKNFKKMFSLQVEQLVSETVRWLHTFTWNNCRFYAALTSTLPDKPESPATCWIKKNTRALNREKKQLLKLIRPVKTTNQHILFKMICWCDWLRWCLSNFVWKCKCSLIA